MNLLRTVALVTACAITARLVGAPAKCECCAQTPEASGAVKSELSATSLYQLDANWTTDAGQNFALAALRGRPVVIAMFFASCEYACPVLVSDMQRLRESLPENVRNRTQFVLVSFDTARDTPAVLNTYRKRGGMDEHWTLLRGTGESVQELAMLLGVKYKQDVRGQFSHSNLITVLNERGEIAYQRTGLMGDVSETAKAVVIAAR